MNRNTKDRDDTRLRMIPNQLPTSVLACKMVTGRRGVTELSNQLAMNKQSKKKDPTKGN